MTATSSIRQKNQGSAPYSVSSSSEASDSVKKATTHIWQAEQYHYNSSAQKDAALRLLGMVSLKGKIRVLDVGCGDGKITREIAEKVPDGSVHGTDVSPQMIAFAQTTFPSDSYPNLTFSCQDGQFIDYPDSFDVVFSSFAIQWMKDKDSFFQHAKTSLNPNGFLACTIPLGISSALEQAISEIIALPEWTSYFSEFAPGWHFVEADEYAHLLAVHEFAISHFAVVPQDAIFPSRERFESYVLQWFSYLRPLPEELKQAFFKQVIDRYFELEPVEETGEAHLKFSRLEIIASKTTL